MHCIGSKHKYVICNCISEFDVGQEKTYGRPQMAVGAHLGTLLQGGTQVKYHCCRHECKMFLFDLDNGANCLSIVILNSVRESWRQ